MYLTILYHTSEYTNLDFRIQMTDCLPDRLTSNVCVAVTIYICTGKIPGSKLGRFTGHPKIFRGTHQSLKKDKYEDRVSAHLQLLIFPCHVGLISRQSKPRY
jgi:hypothetical protein